MESVCQMISTVIQSKSNLPDKNTSTQNLSVDQSKQTFVNEMLKSFDQVPISPTIYAQLFCGKVLRTAFFEI
jgi:hypothetical protein